MSLPAIADFTIERTQSKEEASTGVARYRFSVDMHLDLAIVEESEVDPEYLKTLLRHGLRQLARNVKRRMAEVVD